MAKISVIGTRGYPSFYGGFETAVRFLAPFLAERGWSVTVYGRRRSETASTYTAHPNVREVVTPGFETKSLSTLSHGFSSVMHALVFRPDVALVMNVAVGFWLPLLKMARIPTVVNVDGIEWERAKWGKAGKAFFLLGAKMTARFGDTLIADSEEILKRWKSEFGRNCVFIPYGGSVVTKTPPPLGLSVRDYVLLVARFVPENTVEEFFEAVSDISTHTTVVIVGSAGYGDSLDTVAKVLDQKHGNVHYLGHIADDGLLHSLWANAGLYFHGHSVGGTNPALVQAMACGAPILARESIYNREVLGEDGAFVEADSGAIASKIALMMGDAVLLENLSKKNMLRSSQRYNWDSICLSYENELLRVSPRSSIRLSEKGAAEGDHSWSDLEK